MRDTVINQLICSKTTDSFKNASTVFFLTLFGTIFIAEANVHKITNNIVSKIQVNQY